MLSDRTLTLAIVVLLALDVWVNWNVLQLQRGRV